MNTSSVWHFTMSTGGVRFSRAGFFLSVSGKLLKPYMGSKGAKQAGWCTCFQGSWDAAGCGERRSGTHLAQRLSARKSKSFPRLTPTARGRWIGWLTWAECHGNTNVIRIKASDEGQLMKKTKVFAKGYFNHFGINKTGKFKAEYNQEENALHVDISQNRHIIADFLNVYR